MITAGTASLATGEWWHQIGLQWDERCAGEGGGIQCADKTTLLEFLILGSANCHDSSLLTRPAKDALIHACIFWNIFFYSAHPPQPHPLFCFLEVFLVEIQRQHAQGIYFPSYFSPPNCSTHHFAFFIYFFDKTDAEKRFAPINSAGSHPQGCFLLVRTTGHCSKVSMGRQMKMHVDVIPRLCDECSSQRLGFEEWNI